MTTKPCNCIDAALCTELPPTIEGSKLMVLNSLNCPQTLVPMPGSVVFSDGSTVVYSDGSAARPLSLPGLVEQHLIPGATIPSILSKLAGGVIAAINPPEGEDGLVLQSLAGDWVLARLPQTLCYPSPDVEEECCCPDYFAVWVSDLSGENFCLKRFSPCQDATTITSGSILACGTGDSGGCMRKLVGTQDDQVPIWDSATSTWAPGNVSSLVPTPTSVVDVAFVQGTKNSLADGETATALGITSLSVTAQSDTLVNISSGAVRIINAGFYKFDFAISGYVRSFPDSGGTPPSETDHYLVYFRLRKNGGDQNGGFYDWSPIVVTSPDNLDDTFALKGRFHVTTSQCFQCAANDLISFSIISGQPDGCDPSYGSPAWASDAGGLSCLSHRLNGTVTRIT